MRFNTGVGVLASYGYDQLGNMTAKTFGNGVVQTYAFDAISRLKTLTNDLAGAADDLTVGGGTTPITYSPASQIKSTTRTGDAYPYTGFTALSRDYVVNGLNQTTSSVKSGVTTTYTYDSKGNLTNDGTSGFTYSSENLLKSGPNSSALTYDPMMRLFQVSGAATTRFGYDGLNMTAEYNSSNALLRRYVFAPGLDAPIVWYEGTGTTDRRFLSADERGSIIAASNSSGTKLSTNGYDEYGVPQSPASAGAGTSGVGTVYGRFGYTGQAWIPEVGLYYYKARFYSPTFGRFMQTDPIGYRGGANLYAYVGNDPVNFVDPLGLYWVCNTVSVTVGDGQTKMGLKCYDNNKDLSGKYGSLLGFWRENINIEGPEVVFDVDTCTGAVTEKKAKSEPVANDSQGLQDQGTVGTEQFQGLPGHLHNPTVLGESRERTPGSGDNGLAKYFGRAFVGTTSALWMITYDHGQVSVGVIGTIGTTAESLLKQPDIQAVLKQRLTSWNQTANGNNTAPSGDGTCASR